MQILALDKERRLTSCKNAERQVDYFCPECGASVRLRGGLHRQPHFFHLRQTNSCRQSQKSLQHLQVQWTLQQLFTEEECSLEVQFPEIGRIADVVWMPKKLIFEVQCSRISKDEVESRNRDYNRLGYNVIWILHEKNFNRWRVSAAELFLRGSPYYYTNMDSSGEGEIYDQIDVFSGGVRRTFRKIYSVDFSAPQIMGSLGRKRGERMPRMMQTRLMKWQLHFRGDLIDQWLCAEKETLMALEEAARSEGSYYSRFTGSVFVYIKQCLHAVFLRPYSLLLQVMLEKSCR